MDSSRSIIAGLALAVTFVSPTLSWAAEKDAVPEDAIVEFGEPAFPQQPAPANHFLFPDEVTIAKGGTVTFNFNGANHAVAIYPVSKNTVRADIEAGLCQPDPATCNPQNTATSNLEYFIVDGAGNLVIDTGMNPPSNRVDDPFDRLMYAGGGSFLIGANPLATPPVTGTQIQYRFPKVGRYLVVCADRNHFINDRMFGFVNVVRGGRTLD